jgi:hypothetical protein
MLTVMHNRSGSNYSSCQGPLQLYLRSSSSFPPTSQLRTASTRYMEGLFSSSSTKSLKAPDATSFFTGRACASSGGWPQQLLQPSPHYKGREMALHVVLLRPSHLSKRSPRRHRSQSFPTSSRNIVPKPNLDQR